MNPMQQMVMQMQKAQRELQKAHAELEVKEFKTNKAGLVDITVLGSKEIVSIKIEADGFEAGIYLYSLVADGKLIDTKRMIHIDN